MPVLVPGAKPARHGHHQAHPIRCLLPWTCIIIDNNRSMLLPPRRPRRRLVHSLTHRPVLQFHALTHPTRPFLNPPSGQTHYTTPLAVVSLVCVISLCERTYQTETAMSGDTFYSATITLVPPVTLVLHGSFSAPSLASSI